ncbi:hypothetical protein Anas_12433 [Armadillidium nasatum]|uniref:Uncharacterized protein n=1 Tax=Armadillidium nasatum TaxID=96803 RepID=A0A5N5T7H3_9CRUS|nr:hypothetical protein Anas_12433 [Armadillidium nasatum]
MREKEGPTTNLISKYSISASLFKNCLSPNPALNPSIETNKNMNPALVVKSYHHALKDEKLEVESFLHITFMYLKFIHKQGLTKDIYPILDYLERKKILDSRIFISISSILKVHMDKNVSFRFFSVMFKLEPSFDVSECFSLIDLAIQYETALAVNAVSYSIKVCNCLPSIDQVSLILNRLKSDFPDGNLILLDKLCFGLPRTTLSSVAGSLKSLLTNCPPSRSLEEFYEKIKSKGLNLRTSFNYENNESVECQNPNSIGDVNELVSFVVSNENLTTSSLSEASSVNSYLQDKSYFSDMYVFYIL